MSDHFNEKAKNRDTDEIVKKLSSSVGASILQNTRLNENMDVMDFGAGTGLISYHIAPFINKIIAVDISEAMLDKLAAKPELQGFEDVHFSTAHTVVKEEKEYPIFLVTATKT